MPKKQQSSAEAQGHEGLGSHYAINRPGVNAKAKQVTINTPLGPQTHRYICADVAEVLDGAQQPDEVWAATMTLGSQIPFSPGTIPAEPLPPIKGVSNGGNPPRYLWTGNPSFNKNPGELVRVPVAAGSTEAVQFVVWFRRGGFTYYVESRKTTVTHNPADNNCDPH